MSFIQRNAKLLAVALSCLVVGAAASAIASAGAATSSTSSHAARAGTLRHGGLMALIRRGTVHASLITYTEQGFVTVTIDRGFVQRVSGNSLTIREGTKNETYKTLALSLPAGTVVRDNRARSSLSALRPGEHVLVVQGPQRALVLARG
jgi:hypothetical protein